MLFARHFIHIAGVSVLLGGAFSVSLFRIFDPQEWWFKLLIAGIPVYFFLVIYFIINPFLIEHYDHQELNNKRQKISDLILDNFIKGDEKFNSLDKLGMKDDLVFKQALKIFKKLNTWRKR